MTTPRRECFRTCWRYGLAVVSEWLASPLRVTARVIVRHPATPPSQWRRLLLLGDDHIGDVLFTTGSIPYLAEAFSNCKLDFLCGAPANQVLNNNPYLHRVILRDSGKLWQRTVRESGYDAILCYNMAHHIGDLALALRTRIPNRIAYAHKGFSAWVTHPLPIRHPQPFAAYFRDAVAHLTGQDGSWPLRPMVYPLPADRIVADQTANRIGLDREQPSIACFCSSRQPRGVAPPALFMSLLAALQQASPGLRIVLMGAASDGPLLENIRAVSCPGASILAGVLPLHPLVEFLKHFDLVLTPDSGPRHLANAAGVPVAFFRNICVVAAETGSYGVETELDLVPPDVELLPMKAESGFWNSQEERVAGEIAPAILRLLQQCRMERPGKGDICHER